MKPTKSQRKKKMRQKKVKREGRRLEKAKRKSQDCCVTFKPQNYLEILLSVYSQTLQANILHLDRKALKCQQYCTTCKWLYGKF